MSALESLRFESTRKGEYRVFYVAKFEDAVYVLHVFQKKSKRGISMPRRDLELVRERLLQAEAIDMQRRKDHL